jgi:hypothetical protein
MPSTPEELTVMQHHDDDILIQVALHRQASCDPIRDSQD